MSEIKIKFNIENFNNEQFENAWDIEGGLLVEKNGIILTKRVDDPNDSGYRGDYVFFNLLDLLTSAPELLSGRVFECQLIDSVESFVFQPKDEVTYFKYFVKGMGQLIENENKRYPNFEDGTPIITKYLVSELIKVSENFFSLIEPKINDKSNLKIFKEAIFNAKKLLNDV